MEKKRVSAYASHEKKYMYSWQRHKDRFVSPIIKVLAWLKITPNHLSYASIVSGILFLCFISYNIKLSLTFLILGVIFDGLDGPLARKSKKVFSKGILTDAFSDHILILTTTIGFALIDIIQGWVGMLYIFSYTALVAFIFARNIKQIPYRFVFRPRLFVYLFFLVYAIWEINLVNLSMIVFSIPMLIQLTVGFFKLREKI